MDKFWSNILMLLACAGAGIIGFIMAWKRGLFDDEIYGRWISVERKPVPTDGKEYLLKTKTGIVSGWYCPGSWSKDTSISEAEYTGAVFVCYDDEFEIEIEEYPDGSCSSEVTHWMRIPE